MKRITLFSFGYYGWGNATPQLMKAADAIERKRGFRPPIFVDTRIQRSGRAPGFVGSAFQDLLGERYTWMKSLGNKRIRTGKGKAIQIAKPEAANELLNLAIQARKENRRVIFFCGCEFPKEKGKHKCHRSVIADLLINAAKNRKAPIAVAEWPGGERPRLKMKLSDQAFRAVRRGAMFVPVAENMNAGDLLGPPWGTIMTFTCGKQSIHRVVGPLIWRWDRWNLRILQYWKDPDATLGEYRDLADEEISDWGLDAQFWPAPRRG